MGVLRTSMWALAALMVAPASANAQAAIDVCALLSRIMVYAQERPAFVSVQRRLERGEAVMPPYDAEYCQVTIGKSVSCSAIGSRTIFAGRPDLATCPGIAAVEEPVSPSRTSYGWIRVFRVEDLRVEYGLGCLTCAGPATNHFRIVVVPRDPHS